MSMINFECKSNNSMINFECKNNKIYANGQEFNLKGLSWFGMETDIFVPHGLWGSLTIQDVLNYMTENHFNAMRVPLAVDCVINDPLTDKSKLSSEPKLFEKTYLEVLDILVEECSTANILIMLDFHVLHKGGEITPLWYNDAIPETEVIEAWKKIARRYKDSWNVFAAELKNEPHDDASWGMGNKKTDWNLAAEVLGNAVHEICPRWLIFVGGVGGNIAGCQPKEALFWGEGLNGVRTHPIQLQDNSKLVLSPHVYGPNVYEQTYFKHPDFPKNMAAIWDDHFGFVLKTTSTPLVVSEWGGKHDTEMEKQWELEFIKYLKEHQIGFFYWCFNPNSNDTGGLLLDDWCTKNEEKIALLSSLPSTSIASIRNA